MERFPFERNGDNGDNGDLVPLKREREREREKERKRKVKENRWMFVPFKSNEQAH